ncbi:MAG: TetR/AcrR family transcriptional regulator [Pseudomonadota bacterium]
MTAIHDDNRARTLKAARKLFFEQGFAKTSTAEIAKMAGTSKSTLYAGFGSMEGLLRAVIEAEVALFNGARSLKIGSYSAFRSALVAFGARLLEFLNQPDTIHFARMMNEQARHHPGPTAEYFEAAYRGTAQQLEALLQQGARFLPRPQPPDLAGRYIAFLKGDRFEMAVLGLLQEPYPNPRVTSLACVDWMLPQLERSGDLPVP